MRESLQSAVVQGRFGRVATHATARAVVEHAHHELNFIFKTGGADTRFRVGQHEYLLDSASAILVNPWMPHAKLLSANGDATLVLTVLPDPEWLAAVLRLGDLPLVKLFSSPCVSVSPTIKRMVDDMAHTMGTASEFAESLFEPMLRELVLAVTDAYADPDMKATSHRRERPMDPRISKALGIIRKAAVSSPNLDDVASTVGLSRSRFFELFKACIGASPQQYLDWARMAVATEMLASTSKSVKAVSFELGFSAPSHFARFFTQHMGVPPSNFKRGIFTEQRSLGTFELGST